MKKIEYIDFAKGYAIFTIVLYHALQRVALPGVLQKAIVFGGTGVHLFFLLSGFGLGLSKSGMAAGVFYKRRLSKVWLPYVLALTISLLSALLFGLFPDGLQAWMAGVGLYQMFYEPWILSFGGHFWFISAIVQFYIAYPLLLRFKQKIGNDGLFVATTLAISAAWWLAVYFLGKGDLRIWNSFFLQFLWEFALGMALADAFRSSPETSSPLHPLPSPLFWNYPLRYYLPVALFFTGLMIAMILKMGGIGRIFNDIPALIGYTALSVFIYRIGLQFWPPLKNFFLWIGGFSYSLYLIHVLVLEAWLHASGRAFELWMIAPYLALALAAGRVFEFLSRRWVALFEKF
jgi:peptidoglycan/LPS O-acetylase OafA/YrhL